MRDLCCHFIFIIFGVHSHFHSLYPVSFHSRYMFKNKHKSKIIKEIEFNSKPERNEKLDAHLGLRGLISLP